MTVEQPESFQILADVGGNDYFNAFHAVYLPTQRPVRLTRISKQLSESPAFRAAFRKDEVSLSNLHHANILQFLFRGEDNGQLFYVTEMPEGDSLAVGLQRGQSFSWDEFTDIGWQIASALQHAHNLGLAHGLLTPESVMVSEDLRAEVAGFGLYRWIAAATASSDADFSWSALARRDLIALGRILATVSERVHPDTESAADERQVADMRDLIQTLSKPPLNFTARDVQGRLGNMLLQVSGESIEMIDDRKGQGLSRRSIVDELFDEPEPKNATPSTHIPPVQNDSKPAWLRIGVIVFLTVLLLWALWLLFTN